jgi:hypothetical protein
MSGDTSEAGVNRPDPLPGANRWIALHRASLMHHLEQCVPRGAGQALDRVVDIMRSLLTRRFLTTVCGVSLLLAMPLVWLR